MAFANEHGCKTCVLGKTKIARNNQLLSLKTFDSRSKSFEFGDFSRTLYSRIECGRKSVLGALTIQWAPMVIILGCPFKILTSVYFEIRWGGAIWKISKNGDFEELQTKLAKTQIPEEIFIYGDSDPKPNLDWHAHCTNLIWLMMISVIVLVRHYMRMLQLGSLSNVTLKGHSSNGWLEKYCHLT